MPIPLAHPYTVKKSSQPFPLYWSNSNCSIGQIGFIFWAHRECCRPTLACFLEFARDTFHWNCDQNLKGCSAIFQAREVVGFGCRLWKVKELTTRCTLRIVSSFPRNPSREYQKNQWKLKKKKKKMMLARRAELWVWGSRKGGIAPSLRSLFFLSLLQQKRKKYVRQMVAFMLF